jgi:3-oxoacyl-[acyl-carrier-protein] synthase II
MAASTRRSVITGIGVLSAVGTNPATFWENLSAGRTGIKRIQHVDPEQLPFRVAAYISDFDAKKQIDKKMRKALNVMARTVQLGVVAAQLAMENAKMGEGQLDPARFGIEFGASMIASDLDDIARASKISTNCKPGFVDYEIWGAQGLSQIPPLWMLKYLPNMPACHVSIQHNAQGPNNTMTASDVAGILALGEAFRISERGTADFFLVGATESKMNPLSLSRHATFQQLSRKFEHPEKVLRPFDQGRDGTVMGEGAGVLGLEDLEHATKRGAKIYAELLGFASGFDRKKDGEVLGKIILKALKEARVSPEEIDHVNAHGIGTPSADIMEARGIANVFGTRTPVVAYKPNFGTMGAAGGLVELTASILALENGLLPPTLNCENQDPACPIHIHKEGLRPVTKPHFVKISFTDMGQVAVAVLKKPE